MPSLDITFSDEEHALLKRAAERSGLSLEAFAHDAVVAAVDSKRNVNSKRTMRDQLLHDTFSKSAELNERLA